MRIISTWFPPSSSRRGIVLAAAVPLFLLGGIGLLLAEARSGLVAVAGDEETYEYDLFEYPSVRRPPAVPAASAPLTDDLEVIGVSVGGRQRAYLLEALVPKSGHVVNDVVGECPVTVTFCPLADRVKVYRGEASAGPLDLAVGGLCVLNNRGCMLIKHGDVRYRHDTGAAVGADVTAPFPYQGLDYVRTTWGKWRAAHPDTDVFVGGSPPAGPPTRHKG